MNIFEKRKFIVDPEGKAKVEKVEETDDKKSPQLRIFVQGKEVKAEKPPLKVKVHGKEVQWEDQVEK